MSQEEFERKLDEKLQNIDQDKILERTKKRIRLQEAAKDVLTGGLYGAATRMVNEEKMNKYYSKRVDRVFDKILAKEAGKIVKKYSKEVLY